MSALADIPCTIRYELCYRPIAPHGTDSLGVTGITWEAQTYLNTYAGMFGLLIVGVIVMAWMLFRYWAPRAVNYVEDADLLQLVNALGGNWEPLTVAVRIEDVPTQPIDLQFLPGPATVEA